MRVGIVGAEQRKFNTITEAAARALVRELLRHADTVVSGRCHLGGADIFAAEEGSLMGLEVVEHLPVTQQWSPGYKERNLKIAQDSDVLHCLTLAELPASFKGRRHDFCYHCDAEDHIKSGGCWTALKVVGLGKPAFLHIIYPDGGLFMRSY